MNDWTLPSKSVPPREVEVLTAYHMKTFWSYHVAEFDGKEWLDGNLRPVDVHCWKYIDEPDKNTLLSVN